jgi:undecaprenyl-diphosphatase
MTLFQAFVLGVVQGVTEFLPISSSAHLVLVPSAVGWELEPGYAFVFDILVQMGTLLAVIVCFAPTLARLLAAAWDGVRRRRLFDDPDSRPAWLVLVATVPAVILGVALHDLVEAAFNSVTAASFFLLVTAALLAGAERFGRPERPAAELRFPGAIFIGLAQGLALFPGISRSGATISAGLLRGLLRPEAARFSFLMSIPVMLGAGLIGIRDLLSLPVGVQSMAPIVAGFVTAAVVGYLSIRWLLGYLATHRLYPFAIYCAAAGLLGLALGIFRG